MGKTFFFQVTNTIRSAEMQTFRENDENVFMNGRIDGVNQEHLFENSISSDFDHLNVIGNGELIRT